MMLCRIAGISMYVVCLYSTVHSSKISDMSISAAAQLMRERHNRLSGKVSHTELCAHVEMEGHDIGLPMNRESMLDRENAILF